MKTFDEDAAVGADAFSYWNSWIEQVDCSTVSTDKVLIEATMARPDYSHSFPPPVISRFYRDAIYDAGLAAIDAVVDVYDNRFGGSIGEAASFLGFADPEVEFFATIASPRTVEMARSFARPDFMVGEGGLQLVECNFATSLGGINTIDPYNSAFLKTNFVEQMPSSLSVDWLQPPWEAAVRYFDRTSRWDGSEQPLLFLALAGPHDRNLGYRSFRELASRCGYSVATGLIADLSTDPNRGVAYNGRRVDVIVSSFTWSECKEHVPLADIARLADLDADGLVSYIAPPLYAIFDCKRMLSLINRDNLSDRWESLLPETAILTTHHDTAMHQKDDWVLKPVGSYGGNGVVIGHSVSNEQWQTALMEAGTQGSDKFILQRLVAPKIFEIGDEIRSNVLSYGPLIFRGRPAGILARRSGVDNESAIPLLNQKQGATGSSVAWV